MTFHDCAFHKDGKFLQSSITDEAKPLPLQQTINWNLLNESNDLNRKKQVKALKRAFLRIGLVIPINYIYFYIYMNQINQTQ